MSTPFEGCGAPACRVIFRGRTKRTFSCAACESKYDGSGKVAAYATDVLGVEAKPGVWTGPARTCGQETNE